MLKISQRGQVMPPSPIRKLVPFAEAAKKKGIKVFFSTLLVSHNNKAWSGEE